jgi:SAM-dependent methyltransferase
VTGPSRECEGERVNGPLTTRPGAFTSYYDATEGRAPRPTLLFALDRFRAPGFAIDLGCGDGRDAVELLRRGWSVLAIDAEDEAIARLRARTAAPGLETIVARFEGALLPAADLVNASFALPLCPPEQFSALWRRISTALAPGGRFAGQLYGKRDGWAGRPGMTHHDRAEALALFTGFELERFEEEESDAVTPRGQPKHWHIFHIVARRR